MASNLIKLLFLMTIVFINGCAGLLQDRTFINEMDKETDGPFVAGQDFETVSGDSGMAYRSQEEIRSRTPASVNEAKRRDSTSSLYQELEEKERKLTMSERELYFEIEDNFESPSERIYYLSLTPEERRDYLDARRIEYGEGGSFRRGYRGLSSLQPVYRQALELGMSKGDVVQVWGRPAQIEVAGNPANENERWSFYENGNVKQVYFERGAVQGWNMR